MVRRFACPNKACTIRIPIPSSINSVAAEWRNLCGVRCGLIPKRLDSTRSRFRNVCDRSRRPTAFRKSGDFRDPCSARNIQCLRKASCNTAFGTKTMRSLLPLPRTIIWEASAETSRIFRLVSSLIRRPVTISSLMIRIVISSIAHGVSLAVKASATPSGDFKTALSVSLSMGRGRRRGIRTEMRTSANGEGRALFRSTRQVKYDLRVTSRRSMVAGLASS